MNADIDLRVIVEMASAGPVVVTFKSGIKVRIPDVDHVRLHPSGVAELTTADGWQGCADPGRVAAVEPAGPEDMPPSGLPIWM